MSMDKYDTATGKPITSANRSFFPELPRTARMWMIGPSPSPPRLILFFKKTLKTQTQFCRGCGACGQMQDTQIGVDEIEDGELIS